MARRHARQIVAQLVNARLSAKSAKGYQSFAFIVQPMLARIRAVYCQDAASTERFLALGAQAQTAGNPMV
ncbi:MAG: glycosyltransferase N-terminal domain-containing protein [Rheinheimera sp.]|nr:glycosyltransferase N-terminal domain-containing protein [Rheinheimera sp.]